MRLSAAEKFEIIKTVTTSEGEAKKTLESFGIAKFSFYKWYQIYLEKGYTGYKASSFKNINNDN